MTERSPLVRVGHVDDFREGEWVFRVVEVDEKEVGILRWRGEFFAIRNQCPHLGGPICSYVKPHARTNPASLEWELDFDRPVVVCAWHRWEFDVRTGKAIDEPAMRAKTLRVVVADDGSVLVEPSSTSGRTPQTAGASRA